MPNPDKLLYDIVLLDKLDCIIAVCTPEPVEFDVGRILVEKLHEQAQQTYCLIDEIDLSQDNTFPMPSVKEH